MEENNKNDKIGLEEKDDNVLGIDMENKGKFSPTSAIIIAACSGIAFGLVFDNTLLELGCGAIVGVVAELIRSTVARSTEKKDK